MGLTSLEATKTTISDSKRPIKESHAEYEASETNFVVNKEETGRTCDGDSRQKKFLNRGRNPCILQNGIVLLSYWQLAHSLVRPTKNIGNSQNP